MRHESILIALIVGVNLLWLFVILPSNRGRGSGSARQEDVGAPFTAGSPSTGSISYQLKKIGAQGSSGSQNYYALTPASLFPTGILAQQILLTPSTAPRGCSSRRIAPSWQTRSGSLRWMRSPEKWSIPSGKHATDTVSFREP